MAKISAADALRLGLEHHQAGRFDLAEQLYRKVLVFHGNNADALHLLGLLLRQTGRVRTGIDLLHRAVALNPAVSQYHNHLGQALRDLHHLEEAADEFRTAIALDAKNAEAHNNLGAALFDLRQTEKAIASFNQAILLAPALPDPHSNLASALLELGRLEQAVGECRVALSLNPIFPEAHNNLANALCEQGLVDEAIAEYRAAVQLAAHFLPAWGNLLFTLHTHPAYDVEKLLAEHRAWAERVAGPFTGTSHTFANNRDAERRLRIGFVSSDFRDHPVGRFILPLFKAHDREKFEIICYADVPVADEYTRQIQSHIEHWHATESLSDADLAYKIRLDAIDILFDLRVHSSPNRLLAFARKPAPIQVSYLGYPGTSALSSMDYRLTDAQLDPPGNDRFYSEESIRLTGSYFCFEPHPAAPEVQPPPALKSGYITFGCLSNFGKISAPARDLWRALLAAIPNSRLLLHAHPGAHLNRLRMHYAGSRIDPDRLEFIGRQTLSEYFAAYHRIDIALDPFPFTGGATTVDALWMGAAVVTLAGQTAVQRQGVSILSHAGLPELIAQTPDDYLRIASALAGDVHVLATMRTKMRDKLGASALMDAKRCAAALESACRDIWSRWCHPIAK